MNKPYQQLSIEERESIHQGLWQKQSIRTIAAGLGRSPSTVSREIRRNVPPQQRRYTPRLAQARATTTICQRGQRPRLKDPWIQDYVVQKLQEDFSPEQIAGRLHLDYAQYSISPEAIYQFIYAQYYRGGYGQCHGLDLRHYLKRRHKQRRRNHVPYPSERGSIIGRISIDERPAVVDQRLEQGHWEGDSIVSRTSVDGLNTLVERVSGLVHITKIANSTKVETTRAVLTRLRVLPHHLRQTLTLDNGHENAGHRELTTQLGMAIYFAHPYHSWERGTNENTNGLIRYYLPKGTDFATIPVERIQWIEQRLNHRPRKRLGWKTPAEVFNQGVALKSGI